MVILILLTPLVATTIVLAVSFIAVGLRDLYARIRRKRARTPEPEDEEYGFKRETY
jgi:hypothetical protein